MKDYSRKNYTDHQYRDWMRTPSSKSIFNQILEATTGLGEFSNNKSNKSSLSRAIARYLKQSEFKKPYEADQGFIQMENDWEGPPGMRMQFPRFDNPAGLQYPTVELDTTIFDAEHTGSWCVEYDTTVKVTGTHPIYLLTITWGTDCTITNITGYGTNAVTCTLHVPDPFSGRVTIEASMTSSKGVVGDSNVNVYEKDTCCIFTGQYRKIAQTGIFHGEGGQRYNDTEQSAADHAYNEARTPTPGNGHWHNNGSTARDKEVWFSLFSTPQDVGQPPPFDGWTGFCKITRAYLRFDRFTDEVHKAHFQFWGENPDYYPADSKEFIFCTYTGADTPTSADITNYGPAVTDPFIVNADGTPAVEYSIDINKVGIAYMNAGGTRFVVMHIDDFNNVTPTMPYSDNNYINIFSGATLEAAFMRISYNC